MNMQQTKTAALGSASKIASPLSRKATLVAVKISQWTARKLDKQITDDTNQRHNASSDAGRYNKLLINTERLAEITSLVSKARQLHYSMTSPWADEGARVLPNALYSKFTDEFRILKRDFNDAADKFCADYPSFIEERKGNLKSAFKSTDYPSAGEIRHKFNLSLLVLPFPDAADFRSDLDDDTIADIKAELSNSSKEVLEDAMKHTSQRILKTVGHMAEKLKAYGEPNVKRNFFMDSLVENVRELAELLPAFNLTDDPKFATLAKRIVKELCAEDAEVLRQNDDVREAVAKSADEIVAQVEKFFA